MIRMQTVLQIMFYLQEVPEIHLDVQVFMKAKLTHFSLGKKKPHKQQEACCLNSHLLDKVLIISYSFFGE